MKRLLIAGLGGMGRELYGYLLDDQSRGLLPADLEIAGIDDGDQGSLHEDICSIYRGRISDYRFSADERVLLAVGNVKLRRSLTAKMADNGALFYTYVHSSCYVAKNAEIGEGTVVCAQSIVNVDARIAAHSLVNVCCNVAHDARIGAFAVLSPFSAVNGHAVAGEGLFMGTHSTLFPGVTVGENCTVSAHGYVSGDIGDGIFVQSDGCCHEKTGN